MSVKILIDNIRNSERPVTIPRINPFRGANADEIEHTAFEIERMTTLYLANMYALIGNLNSDLPLGRGQVDAGSRLVTVFDLVSDIASDVRSKTELGR